MEIAFKDIEKEFSETFGYVRQDIDAILKNNLGLNYTIALLVCCACEMLTWHRGLRDDQAHEIFTSLLPATEAFKTLGKTLWEALRNGLAHRFRPDTIRIQGDEWRFTITSVQSWPLIMVYGEQPCWISLNIREFSTRVICQIDAYEQELRNSVEARAEFFEKSTSYLKDISPEAARISNALSSLPGTSHD